MTDEWMIKRHHPCTHSNSVEKKMTNFSPLKNTQNYERNPFDDIIVTKLDDTVFKKDKRRSLISNDFLLTGDIYR